MELDLCISKHFSVNQICFEKHLQSFTNFEVKEGKPRQTNDIYSTVIWENGAAVYVLFFFL
jgi:hypothetical protein